MLKRTISDGEKLPWGYGIAYARWDCRRFVCYPVPLNILVHRLREFWFWLISSESTQRERIEELSALLDHERQRNYDLTRKLWKIQELLYRAVGYREDVQ